MKRILYLITALTWACYASGQTDCLFTHYSSEDGLSQNTIMDILQDRKGNLWFSTWDGLNLFDGYTFKVYKARPDNHIKLNNNRIDHIYEDRYGYFWLLTYDKQAYRFDPRTEVFEHVPAGQEKENPAPVSAIRVLDCGSVWLLTERGGATRITTDPQSHCLSSEEFGGLLVSARLHDVYEDEEGREWMLTDNGLGMLLPGGEKPVSYFTENSRPAGPKAQAFFCGADMGTEVFFGSDNGRIWRYREKDGQFQLLQLPAASPVVCIRRTGAQEALLLTAREGFFLCNTETGELEHYAASLLPDAPLVSAYVDKGGEVWLEQHLPGTVAHFNLHDRQLKRETISVEPTSTDRARPAFHVHEDIHGQVWVHPYGGGFSRFDRKKNRLEPFFNSTSDGEEWRFSNKLHAAFSDKQGNLWMCTHSKGLEKVTFRPKRFALTIPVPQQHESLSNEVRAIFEDAGGQIWVGTKDSHLHIYGQGWEEKGYLTENGTIARTGKPLQGNAYFIMQDSRGNIWISTKGDGLVKAEPADGRYRLTRYRYKEEDIYSLSDDNVYCTYEDGQGRLWIATFAGGVNYLTQDKEGNDIFISHRNNLKGYPIEQCDKARFITGDGKGNIWIGTTVGALTVNEAFGKPEDAEFKHYTRTYGDPESLSNNDVHWIIRTTADELYLATFGGGLNKLLPPDETGECRFRAYNVKDGLPSDVVLAIREDDKGNLWMSTENGISKFTPATGRFENYSDRGISFSARFSEAASAYTSDRKILFGSSNGIVEFRPDSIGKSTYTPPIVFSKLMVVNQDVAPGGASVLKQNIDNTQELTLSHRENIFTIQFAALDYSEPGEIQYAYMLEGFDKEWNNVGTQRRATYTNLPKGHYTFKVRSTNAEGVWMENTRTLSIVMLPSFWETPFAYFLYVLFFILAVTTAVYIFSIIYRLKHKVYIEQQMTDMKLRFFTDISHELRTPLTLIAGPVDYVLANTPLPDDAREQLKVVERNTDRMLRLINQILDFRKIQNRKMKMEVQRIDVVPFTRKIMQNFESMAEERHIDFLFETETEELYLWADADKYEKIVFNLLSNAFKFTPDGKMIKVFIHEDEKSVSVGVQDQGIGISENKKKSIFVRFENLVDRNLFKQFNSTGIGLSLVKELVDMHQAAISVESKLGEGSCFKVDFLKGRDHYDNSVEYLQDDNTAGMAVTAQEVPDTANPMEPAKETPAEAPATTEEEGKPAQNTMLLVEDNAELRLFLRSIFASEFRIVEAVNGMEGWDKALKFLPDIILCDIMMPEKDGISLTRDLRAELTTSHIPIVLLTAKSAIESRLEGLEYGADDYITKPFSSTYLKVRVRNLLEQRQKLQARYRENLMPTTPQEEQKEEKREPEMSQHDRKFMDKLVALMEANMDNGDLVVDDLVRELAVSRSVFFKKLKTLTGLAPVEFIKEMRINRAVRLIETGEYSMTQISYMVGINDPRYFSKCFKQKMGMTPTEYREKTQK